MHTYNVEIAVRNALLSMRVAEGHSNVSMRLAMLATPQTHLYPSPRIRDLVEDEEFHSATAAHLSPRYFSGQHSTHTYRMHGYMPHYTL